MSRTVIPIDEAFFNDGYWYVLSSTSLGGGQYTAKEVADILQVPLGSDAGGHSDADGAIAQLQSLLGRGVCLPLYFPADCSLDDSVVVLGDLSDREEAEWLGRLQGKLEIPCGEFVVMGGSLEEDLEVMTKHFTAPNPHFQFFQKIKVAPGTYLVEVYAFLGSTTVNELIDCELIKPKHLTAAEQALVNEPLDQWWNRTRPQEPHPPWLVNYLEEGYVDCEQDDGDGDGDLVEYIIRLTPAQGEIPVPPLDPEVHWCGVFEMRKPDRCPQGLRRRDLLA